MSWRRRAGRDENKMMPPNIQHEGSEIASLLRWHQAGTPKKNKLFTAGRTRQASPRRRRTRPRRAMSEVEPEESD